MRKSTGHSFIQSLLCRRDTFSGTFKGSAARLFTARAFALTLICTVLLSIAGCAAEPAAPEPAANPFTTFRDIPDITDEEIAAIEALQARGEPLIYAASHSTELFEYADGTYGGYTVLFCDWLSELIGVPIQIETHNIPELDRGLDSGAYDLAAVMATPLRQEMYSLSGPIIQRVFVNYRYEGSLPLAEISKERLPRYAFTEDSTVIPIVAESLEPGTYEEVIVADEEGLYLALKNDEADVFVLTRSLRAAFDQYGGLYTEDFLPLTILHVSVAAANPDYFAVISVITKAVQGGASEYLADLHRQGYQDYMRHAFTLSLTDEEIQYLRDNPVIPFATQYASYPTSFFNAHEGIWDGVVFEILDEMRQFIGVDFELVHSDLLELPELVALLENETAYFMPNLIYTPERAGRFDWLETYYFTDRYALLSKQSYPNVELNDIPSKRVGLVNGTAFSEAFRKWFPDALYVTNYETSDDAYLALDRGEVDLVMSLQSRLTTLTNYHELSDYKANFLFDESLNITFATNKNHAVLNSILDKALSLMNAGRISEQWMSRTYNFETMRLRTRQPWFIGTTALSLTLLSLVVIVVYKNRKAAIEREKRIREEQLSLEEEHRHLREILDTLPVGIRILSLDDWTLLYSNKACLDVFGCSSFEEQVEGRSGLGFMPEMQPDGRSTAEHLADIVRSDRFISELQCFKLNDQPFLCRITSITIDYAGHRASLAAMEDVTAERELQESLRNAIIKEQESNQLKSRFLAHMSHEIRTPMNAILGITEIELQNESLPTGMAESFGMIYDSGNLLLSIINDILDLSAIEVGKLEIVPTCYDISALVNSAIQITRVGYDNKPIEFHLDIDENTPLNLFGDKFRLEQILNNILSNAYKYTEKGSVRLSISATSEDSRPVGEDEADGADGAGGADGVTISAKTEDSGKGKSDGADSVTLIMRVSDTGVGMTQDELDKLFAEFTRFNLDTAGTGLGMSIAKRLLDLMGGEISVESEPGKGSVFTVHVPQKRADESVCGPDLAEEIRSSRLQRLSTSEKSRMIREYMPYGNVLVVDDVLSNIYVAKGMLLPYGLNIDSAESGRAAIEKIKNGNVYDIIFMDHMMPGLDGIETTKVLRGMGYEKSIVALTANALVGTANIFLDNDFDGYISKPIDPYELNAVLLELIRDKTPSEVVEAARREQLTKGKAEDEGESSPKSDDKSEFEELFIMDAESALSVLRELYNKLDSFDKDDTDLFDVTAHGMKGALLNLGETELSDFAYMLEKAAVENNLDLIRAETPTFIKALEKVVKKLQTSEG